ncbi:hypothetical protein GCM10010182_00440 [Actinomadura cremea]|nr:hypothetical protein GCM10010182_00440 [Actinomadura cremea]
MTAHWPGAHRWVRPYVVTGGRVEAPRQVLPHTLVAAPGHDPAYAARLLPESRRLYDRAHHATVTTGPKSLAELSAHCRVPVGAARVLLTDLAAAGAVQIGSDTDVYSPRLLERILDGLYQLT